MDIKEIQSLIDWLTEKGISEFEFKRSDVYLRIRMGKGGPVVETSDSPSAVSAISAFEAMPTPRFLAASPSAAPVAAAPEAPPPEDANIVKVTAPLVGTFHRRPGPKAEPFVEVGSVVKKGQTLCIVEAMKVMNEITATADGEITGIHVEEGEPVEYGETLFSIRAA